MVGGRLGFGWCLSCCNSNHKCIGGIYVKMNVCMRQRVESIRRLQNMIFFLAIIAFACHPKHLAALGANPPQSMP